MLAPGLRVVETGACLCSISSSFQTSVKMSEHWSYDFLEFWFGKFSPILAWYRFSSAEEFVHLINYASVMFSIGERLANTNGLPWTRHHLKGSRCCSKTFIALLAFIVVKFLSLNIYVNYVLLWISYWLISSESLSFRVVQIYETSQLFWNSGCIKNNKLEAERNGKPTSYYTIRIMILYHTVNSLIDLQSSFLL